jgi:hypothetical protein
VIVIFNFVHFFPAVSDNNTDLVGGRELREKRGNGTRKNSARPLFRDNLSAGAYTVSKELNQDPELFEPFYLMNNDLIFEKRYKFSYSRNSRRNTTSYHRMTAANLFLIATLEVQHFKRK